MIVAVIGAGTMGAGIAQVCLVAGHEVRLFDVLPDAADRGRGRIGASLGRMVARGRLEQPERDAALTRLTLPGSLEDAVDAVDVVIEAALEDLEAKRDVFRRLDAAASSRPLLATNTSALSVTDIAMAVREPGRVLGLHFFNPAPLMVLVEVVAGEQTAGSIVERGIAFVEGLGKRPVACRDAPGFIVNRVNRPFTLEALRMLERGESTIEAIDAAIVADGFPMGQFALMDLVGVDVNLAVARELYLAFDEAVRFRPSPIQERLVADGTLGRKSGRGFFRYDAAGGIEGPAEPFAATGAAQTVPDEEIRVRIELAIVNEAYHAAGEGVAAPPDIDLALVLGAAHPVGPFERARSLGLGRVIAELRRLEALHGERFQVAPALWQVASI